MKKEIAKRISTLRDKMRDSHIDAVIIPQTDPHQSEYISDHWQVRRYLSGFTGSAGTLVVTEHKALLWTDSRYFIQAAQQLADTEIVLMRDLLPGTPSIEEYLAENLEAGSTVGIDGMLFSNTEAKEMQKYLAGYDIKLKTDFDIINEIWPDRPSLPKDKIFVHALEYAGEEAKNKIKRVFQDAKGQGADAVFLSRLDEIAWLLNIRCNDVLYNPVATSYLYINDNGATLIIDTDKVDADVEKYLLAEGVKLYPYSLVKDFLTDIKEKAILIEEKSTSVLLAKILDGKTLFADSVVALPKGIKNDVQIAGIKEAMMRDGVAMVKAFIDMENALAAGETITELDVDALLRKYRSQQDKYFDESFGSIVGYGSHGAIVHYEPDEESNATLKPEGLLLIDSGAQYLDGTTDITRTIALGEPTPLEKHDFTLVMKGHIALGKQIFPVGTRGAQLDALARQYLWNEGLSYLHGTGHGVGHFLNVHEGPQTIRLNNTPTPLMLGMVTSNEPGLYRENVHGVRCENMVLTVKAMDTDFGEFLKFENLTLFPFDTKLMEREIMSQEEIDWINDYHKQVWDALSPRLNEAEKAWLASKTAKINK